MKLLHTSDWHLGRTLFQESLLEDQVHALAQLQDVLQDTRPDALLISGDVYDRAVPPKEAVALLDETLGRIIGGLRIPVIMIAGNHDSPERLGFAQDLLRGQGLHIVGPLPDGTPCVALQDDHGPVRFYPLPFADPVDVRSQWGLGDVRTHQQVLEAQMARVREDLPEGTRAVVLAHAFVGGAAQCESEEELAVGGTSQVDASVFDGMAYVALGHLHRPQRAGGDHIRYSGSLLKYSFSEADQPKGVTLVELGRPGELQTRHIPLAPRRDLRVLTGTFDSFFKEGDFGEKNDYLLLQLEDREPVVDAMNRLRQVFPNLLHLDWPNRGVAADAAVREVDLRTASVEDLFKEFFKEVGQGEWREEHQALFQEIIGTAGQPGREA